MRIFAALVITALVSLLIGCSKDSEGSGSEAQLYGIWVKGTSSGDTLWFMRKDGKNIMRINQSFNPSMPFYSEREYRFRNGELSTRLYSPTSMDYYPITSFTWIQRGQEFKIQGIELFMFMSSTMTYFTYRKI